MGLTYGSLEGVEIYGSIDSTPKYESKTTAHDILTTDAIRFVSLLHRTFNDTRKTLLQNRLKVQKELDNGGSLKFLKETEYIRNDPNWRCPVPSPGLVDRRSEITGPPDRKMIVNALNTDVLTYMSDFEDSCSPTWEAMVYGQVNLYDAIRKQIDFTVDKTGKHYKIKDVNRHVPTIIVRPRGWHMLEKHVLINGEPISASIFDFGLYFYHNAKQLIANGQGPYFYLPKMEHHLEARLWNDIFNVAQDCLGITRGTIRATVLIETLPAAYQMDEILYELRIHSSGLNCGRWDYIFNTIKRLRNDPKHVLPDRGLVTMKVPFMSLYVQRLIKICHKRGVHAMGGMAAQIPIKDDDVKNNAAMGNVEADKLREVLAGHDGTWVLHPLLAPIANKVFNEHMPTPNQIHKPISNVDITESQLSDTHIENGVITTEGIKINLYIGLNYMESWVQGYGCVPINNLMEDAATAEVSRLQLWAWNKHGVVLNDTKEQVTSDLISKMIDDEVVELSANKPGNKFELVGELLKKEISGELELSEFLTTPLYDHILTLSEKPYDLTNLKK